MKHQSGLIRLMALAPAILVIAAATTVGAKASIDARVYEGEEGYTMPYRILKPANYNSKKRYPLVLCLHGAGGRGNDNSSRGTEAYTALSGTEVQDKYPAFLITPQCPVNKQWVNTPWKNGSYSISRIPISEALTLVVEILDLVEKEFSIDAARIYVTGQSMGGYGTWDIILRYPSRFAAAVPVCGAGDPTRAERIAHIPIWAFHGDKDKTVPIKGTQEMIEALRRAGSSAKFTAYEGEGHNVWRRAWKEKELTAWLFKQHKKLDSYGRIKIVRLDN